MGKEKSLHRNKHDFLLKLKTCQVSGACCLVIVRGEFENLGENNAPRKKCWIRETGEKQRGARSPVITDAGDGRCQGSEHHLKAPGENLRWRERRCGTPSLHAPARSLLQHLGAQQPSCAWVPSPSRQDERRRE